MYLEGKMSEKELKEFREDMKRDPELLQELDLHRSLEDIIVSGDEERFRKKLDEAYKEYKIEASRDGVPEHFSYRTKVFRYIPAALASVILLAAVLYFTAFGKKSNQFLFDKYFVGYNNELTIREQSEAAQSRSETDRGVKFYMQSNYSEAARFFAAYLNEHPENLTAHFYKGLCNIYLNEFEDAIKTFEYMLTQPYSYYQEYAKWYIALCYIKINKNDTARLVLEDIAADTGFFSEKEKKVLRKLR